MGEAGIKNKRTTAPPVRARSNRIHSTLKALDGQLRIEHQPKLAPYVNWAGNSVAPIHRWFRYREAFSPELITQLGLGKRIFDPFCGCGSVPVGAAELGRSSMGVDINPLAVFAAKVKLSPLDGSQIDSVRRFAKSCRKRIRSVEPWPEPKLSICRKVFEPEILDTVLRIRAALEDLRDTDEAVADFLHLAWLEILQKVGSYFKEGNGIKYRNKKRSKGKYVNRPEGEWQRQRFGANQREFTLGAFEAQLGDMLSDTPHWRRGRWRSQTVLEGNALDSKRLAGNRKFDGVLFSPPYANRFDYFESMKVELWFGGFVNSYAGLGVLRKASMRSHLGADLAQPWTPLDPLEDLICEMDKEASSWRMGVASLLRGYFTDMSSILKQCRQLTPKGSCYIVVGNSAFAGVIIPTDALVARLGLDAGFSQVTVLQTRHLTVAPQQRTLLTGLEGFMRESVVICQ